MKSNFYRILLPLLFSVFVLACSEDETVFNPTTGLVKITEGYALGAGAKVELWAERDLFAGYNSLYFALYDSVSGKRITNSHIHLKPVMDMGTMSHSCPVEEPAEDAVNELFPAAIMFTMPSGNMGNWTLEVKVHNHETGLFGAAIFDIAVHNAAPSAVLSFQSTSGNTRRSYTRFCQLHIERTANGTAELRSLHTRQCLYNGEIQRLYIYSGRIHFIGTSTKDFHSVNRYIELTTTETADNRFLSKSTSADQRYTRHARHYIFSCCRAIGLVKALQ